jgi:alpha-L-rhamnosidase
LIVSLRTLRDCMQTVFEDGPKRDRRLWLGDLRLQALADYVSYRNDDLVKRSLYILAGTATDKGLVGTCSLERPQPARGGVLGSVKRPVASRQGQRLAPPVLPPQVRRNASC